MDQSASVMGLEGGALYIKFTPSLDATPVFFPKCNPEFNFVIAKSYVQADKHTTGPVNYNLRVVETTLASKVLAKGITFNRRKKPLLESSDLGVHSH